MTELSFACAGMRSERHSLSPTLIARLRIGEASGAGVHAIALTTQVRVEPQHRRYSDAEAERLHDLFGDRSRWAETMRPLQLATVATMVPGFTGTTEVDVAVPVTTDLEVAAGRYFGALDDGEVPLLLLFSGTVFGVRGDGYEVTRIPWSAEAAYRLPVKTWWDLVDQHFPDRAWIPLGRSTLDTLIRYKNAHALPTWNHVMEALLDRVPDSPSEGAAP